MLDHRGAEMSKLDGLCPLRVYPQAVPTDRAGIVRRRPARLSHSAAYMHALVALFRLRGDQQGEDEERDQGPRQSHSEEIDGEPATRLYLDFRRNPGPTQHGADNSVSGSDRHHRMTFQPATFFFVSARRSSRPTYGSTPVGTGSSFPVYHKLRDEAGASTRVAAPMAERGARAKPRIFPLDFDVAFNLRLAFEGEAACSELAIFRR